MSLLDLFGIIMNKQDVIKVLLRAIPNLNGIVPFSNSSFSKWLWRDASGNLQKDVFPSFAVGHYRLRGMERSYSAFSLVEVIISITIVSVIALLSFSGLKAMRERASSVDCLQKLRQLGIAANLYTGENNGWSIPCSPEPTWFDFVPALAPYLNLSENQEVLMCPGENRLDQLNVSFNYTKYTRGIGTSYVQNNTLFWNGSGYGRVKIASIQEPSRTIYFGETLMYARNDNNYPNGWPRSSWHGDRDSYKSCVVAVDGHVALVDIETPCSIYAPAEVNASGEWRWR